MLTIVILFYVAIAANFLLNWSTDQGW